MNKTVSNVKSRNILVLGAGELGMPVLRNLARRTKDIDGANKRFATRQRRRVRCTGEAAPYH